MRVNNHHTNHQNAYQQNYANPGNSSGTRESQNDQRAIQTANHGQRSRSNGDQSGKHSYTMYTNNNSNYNLTIGFS